MVTAGIGVAKLGSCDCVLSVIYFFQRNLGKKISSAVFNFYALFRYINILFFAVMG